MQSINNKLIRDEIVNHLTQDGEVKLTGIGVFKIKNTAARQGRNPRTGEAVQIPKGKKIAFRVSGVLKKLVL